MFRFCFQILLRWKKDLFSFEEESIFTATKNKATSYRIHFSRPDIDHAISGSSVGGTKLSSESSKWILLEVNAHNCERRHNNQQPHIQPPLQQPPLFDPEHSLPEAADTHRETPPPTNLQSSQQHSNLAQLLHIF
jgi:hypothetical protein